MRTFAGRTYKGCPHECTTLSPQARSKNSKNSFISLKFPPLVQQITIQYFILSLEWNSKPKRHSVIILNTEHFPDIFRLIKSSGYLTIQLLFPFINRHSLPHCKNVLSAVICINSLAKSKFLCREVWGTLCFLQCFAAKYWCFTFSNKKVKQHLSLSSCRCRFSDIWLCSTYVLFPCLFVYRPAVIPTTLKGACVHALSEPPHYTQLLHQYKSQDILWESRPTQRTKMICSLLTRLECT